MKRKFEPTRRRNAARGCGILLAMLVLLHVTRGWFCLTPGMARRWAEAEYGFENTRVVWQDWEDWDWGVMFSGPCCKLTLTETDGVTLLHPNYPTVLGWSRGCYVLDCTTPGPVWCREFLQYDEGRWREVVFGRIDDPAAAKLELNISYFTGYGEDRIPAPGLKPQVFRQDSGQWIEADGRRYFIFRQEYTPQDRDRYIWREAEVTVYDAHGGIIETES